MIFLEFISNNFWWIVLLIILLSNKSTYLFGLMLIFSLNVTSGKPSFWFVMFLEVLACISYVISLKDIWKSVYEKEIRDLKRKLWRLKNH